MKRARWIVFLDVLMLFFAFFVMVFGILAIDWYLDSPPFLWFLLAPAGAVVWWLIYDAFARWKRWPREKASWAQVAEIFFYLWP